MIEQRTERFVNMHCVHWHTCSFFERCSLIQTTNCNANADTFIHDVLPPVLLGHARLHAHTTPGGESAIVQWQPAGHHRSHTKQQPAVVEHDCIQLFQVLSSALFSQSPSTLAAFGRVFWDRFVQLYEQSFIQQAEGASVEVLRLRQEAARHMEQQALQLGFTAAGKHSWLWKYCMSLWHLFTGKKSDKCR